MDPQTIFLPARPRISRKRRPPVAVAAGPVLVAAAYDEPGQTVTLTFDRAVEVSGGGTVGASSVVVDDGEITTIRWGATGAVTVIGPQTLEVALADIGAAPGSATTLTATAATGIVAADAPPGGGAWAGVTGLVLPFP